MKYQSGDRVKALIQGELVIARVERYGDGPESDYYVWCMWDDDNQLATISEISLEFDELYFSPLTKALR